MKKYGRQMKQLSNLGLSRVQRRKKRKSNKKTAKIDPYYLSPAVRLDVNNKEIEYIKSHQTYAEYLKSDVWIKKRIKALKRDKFKCVHCGKRATQVHHKVYTIWGKEKLKHLESVCGDCHKTIHDLQEEQYEYNANT